MQLWRGRWTLLGMLLAAAGAACVTGLTHSRHEFIGPLPFEQRLKCMLATVEYEHEPEYAEYIKPARELCMRNLRDPILISAEQLGEALGFVTNPSPNPNPNPSPKPKPNPNPNGGRQAQGGPAHCHARRGGVAGVCPYSMNSK